MCIRINSLAKQNVSRVSHGKALPTRHSCLHSILTLRIPACTSHMSHFAGCLVLRYLRKLFNLQFLESSHSLYITQPLQSNPTINTWYKRFNRITIKFGTKLKPTKHIVVNHNFTCFFFKIIFLKYKKNTKNNVFVYIGTCIPWMTIEIKFSKLCVICNLDEHFYV